MTIQHAFDAGYAPFSQLPRFVYNMQVRYGEPMQPNITLYHRPDGRIGVAY